MKREHLVILCNIILSTLILLGLTWLASRPTPPDFRVGLVLPEDPNQPGWSSYVLGSAGVIKREFQNRGQTAEISFVTQASPAQAAEAMELFAAQGYDFIVAADDSYIDAARLVAGRYPDSAFALLADTQGNGTNLGALSLRQGELGYIAGRVMAYRTATKKVLYLAGDKTPRREKALDGLKAGIADFDPNIELNVIWGVDTPDEAARIAARAYGQEGVDVINVDSNHETMMAVYETARQWPDAYASNWHIDLSPLYQATTLGSYNVAWADVLTRAAVWVDEGKWEGRRYSFGAGDNAFNVTSVWNLPQEEYEAVWATWKQIYEKDIAQ